MSELPRKCHALLDAVRSHGPRGLTPAEAQKVLQTGKPRAIAIVDALVRSGLLRRASDRRLLAGPPVVDDDQAIIAAIAYQHSKVQPHTGPSQTKKRAEQRERRKGRQVVAEQARRDAVIAHDALEASRVPNYASRAWKI